MFTTFLGGKKAVEVHAAVWVPDSDASVCMHCKKNQFTVLNRRVRDFSHYFDQIFTRFKRETSLVHVL